MPVNQETTRWVVQEDGSKIRVAVPPEVADSDEGHAVPRTHADADAQAAERGLSFPSEDMTVKEKQEFLDQN